MQQGACFGEKLGWERPNWYAVGGRGEAADDRYSFGRPNWFEAVGREHRAAREAAVLFDQSSFAKFVLKGPDAEDALSWICANNVARPVGSLTYTQMLNRSEEHTSELQSLMRNSYAVFCLKKKKNLNPKYILSTILSI